MGELGTAHDVAGGEDGRHGCAEAFVRDDKAVLDGHTVAFQPVRCRVGNTACGNQEQVGFKRVTVSRRDFDSVGVCFDAGDFGTGLGGHPAASEGPFEVGGDERVLARQQAREGFDNGDLGAERCPEAGEFDSDDTAAEDDDRFRMKDRWSA